MAFENQSEHDLLAFTLHLYKACVFSSSATTISFPSFRMDSHWNLGASRACSVFEKLSFVGKTNQYLAE